MLCLDLPLRSRASPSAVRILSLTPPGVHSYAVLNRIIPDITEGMTTGFLDVDGDGNRRRIFLDFVGLGDTPGINSVLDVLGHTGTACCYLCRFTRRTPTLLGSRYASECHHGSNSSFSRGFFEHSALLDCGAEQETCRTMGIKANPDPKKMSLHTFREELFQSREKIPKTSLGRALLPHHWDPYKACFVAPDHLLTGHLRDCLTLCYRLLPNTKFGRDVERDMLSLLLQAGLPPQNRIFDHEKKTLYTISMTELYALAVVAELALFRACGLDRPRTLYPSQMRPRTSAAISLLGSCANLINSIWRKPDLHRDGFIASKDFQKNHGHRYITHVQNEVDKHLSRVCEICTLPDADILILEDPDVPLSEKVDIQRAHRDCIVAIRTIDKPNLHRLRELAHSTLPMLGHMSLVGELVLEKAHQSLKRVVKRSNNKEVHLQALNSIAIDDWKGRLTAVIPRVLRGEESAISHCVRLFSGIDIASSLHGKPANILKSSIVQMLGPANCVHTELQRQGKSVLSPRHMEYSYLSWALHGQYSYSPLNAGIRAAFRSQLSHCSFRTGQTVSSILSTGVSGPCFRRKDVVETLCFRPTQASFHYPFVLQSNCSSNLGHL